MTHAQDIAAWWSNYVAGRVGVPAPTTGHDHWLLLHRSEAAACMTTVEYRLLSQQMGWE